MSESNVVVCIMIYLVFLHYAIRLPRELRHTIRVVRRRICVRRGTRIDVRAVVILSIAILAACCVTVAPTAFYGWEATTRALSEGTLESPA